MSHIDEIQRLSEVQDAHDKLARYGAAILKASRCPEPGDLDGGDLQDMALKAGVLETRTVTEPCGEGCTCAEYSDFPQNCHFVPAPVAALITEMTQK